MTEKLLNAQHIPENERYTHVIKKHKKSEEQTEIWMLFSGPKNEIENELATTIWKKLEEAYFKSEEKNPYDRFEEALKVVNNEIAEHEVVNDADFYRSHSILLAVFAGDTLHLSVAGNAEAYLIRKKRLTPISDGLSPKHFEGDVFANIASGDMEENDSIICSSERILRYATANQLTEMVAESPNEGVEALNELLNMAGEDACFVIFHREGGEETLPFESEKKKLGGSFFSRATSGKAFLDECKKWFEDFFRKLRVGEQKSFLGFVLGVLGLIVIITLITSLSGKSQGDEYEKYKGILSKVQQSLKTVEDFEALGQTDVANANLAKVERDLKEILGSNFFRSEANALYNELSQIQDRINNITRISTPKEIANLKSRKNNVDAKGVFEYGNEWFAFDSNTLFRIVLKGVETVIPLSSESNIAAGVPLPTKKLLVFMDDKNKILEYDVDIGELSFAKTEDDTWKKGVDISSYSDKIYLLSPEDNQIWKYERKSESFGNKIPYLAEEYDISGAISFAIDGEIFVFTELGNLLKFFKGFQQEYEIVGAPPGALEGVTQIYTNERLERILFLNPEESTVYVFHKGIKQAEYMSQIVFENVGTLQRIWGKEPSTLAVVDESSVYTVDF